MSPRDLLRLVARRASRRLDGSCWTSAPAHYIINWLFIILTTIHVYLSVTEDFPAFLDFFGLSAFGSTSVADTARIDDDERATSPHRRTLRPSTRKAGPHVSDQAGADASRSSLRQRSRSLLALRRCAATAARRRPRRRAAPTTCDFTLPTAGQVRLHGVPRRPEPRQKTSGETTISLYVDPAVLDESAHADALCTGCHVDFAYKTPHDNVQDGDEWRRVAKTACKTCKDHDSQHAEITSGSHIAGDRARARPPQQAGARREARRASPRRCPRAATATAVTTSDLDVEVRTRPRRQAALQGRCIRGWRCAATATPKRPRPTRTTTTAPRTSEGAPDAPACWDCHGAH